MPSQGASGGILIAWDARLLTYLDVFAGHFSLSLKFINNLDNLIGGLLGYMVPAPQILNLYSLMSFVSFSVLWVVIGRKEVISILPDSFSSIPKDLASC